MKKVYLLHFDNYLAYMITNITKQRSSQNDVLRISNQRVVGNMGGARFIDKDTGHVVCYIPSLDISGYGNTFEEAMEMVDFSMEELFKYLYKLNAQKRDDYLISLGWKKQPLHNKEYSKAFVDINGELQNFNADKNTIELLELTAA